MPYKEIVFIFMIDGRLVFLKVDSGMSVMLI